MSHQLTPNARPDGWLPPPGAEELPDSRLRVPVVEEFLDDGVIEDGWSGKTVLTYRQALTALARWLVRETGQPFAPGALDQRLIRAWQRHLRAELDVEDATYVKYLSALRSFLAYLRGTDQTALAPEDVKLPRGYTDVSHVVPLSIDELTALLAAPDPTKLWGRRDRALWALFYSTGMRIAEALGRDRRELPSDRLCRAAVLELPIVGKGRKPRVVFLDELAQRLLKEYLDRRDDDYPPLFRSYRGPAGPDRRLSARMVQQAIRDYAIAAGLATIPTPHTLRHSFALHKLEAGADIRIVQAFLGHSSVATTQRYTKVRDRFLRDVYERAHRAIPAPPSHPDGATG
ncbi:MAG: tyrosine-type recombinase/integrase [Chloroflexi bacterium]|nr:tyrosine-type recombinase/integrase [Chloroflexota bacterium]